MVVDQHERRHHPRADFTGITLVRDGRREIPCVAGNLSESGILLYPQLSRQPATDFQVTFTLPWLTEWINVEGRLVRSQRVRRRTEWGIQFCNVPSDVRTVLRSYVRRRDVRGAPSPAEPVEDIPLPPPLPLPEERGQRVTARLRPLGAEREREPTPVPLFVDSSLSSGDIPTRMTLRDEIDDVGASDLPTVVTPRESTLASDGPTRTAGPREAAALRNRCRHN